MKNMKYIICGIALVCVILFSACDNNIETPTSGYGRIRIEFAGMEAAVQMARTVLPAFVFDKYVYTFTMAGEQNGVVKSPENGGFFTLELGSYTVAVQAFTGNAEPYTLAASGVSSSFSVGPGNNDPVEVVLARVGTGAQGKFSYTITYPAGAMAEITLQKWPGLDDITLNPINLTKGNGITETLELETGSYLLTVFARKNGLYAGISEAVNISPSLSTVYTKDFNEHDMLTSIYTVTFSANGASGSVPSTRIVPAGSSIFLPSGAGLSMNNGNYPFVCWNTNADGTGTNYQSGDSYTPAADTTLYAKWNQITYTVTFDINGGSGTTPSAQTGYSITLPSGSGFTKPGRTFDGWSTNAYGMGTRYNAGASYTPDANITLYATWGYSVNFDFNGGYGVLVYPADYNWVDHGSNITLPDGDGLSRTGYTFNGWNANSSGTGTNYNAGASYTVTGSVILYARWAACTEADPFLLTANNWADGSITSTASGSAVWYSFSVTSGTTYYLWGNSSASPLPSDYGDGTKTLGMRVSASYSTGGTLFTGATSAAWTSPRQFTANSSGVVKIKVEPYSSGETGTFGIAYSTSNTRPGAINDANPVPLTANTWTNGSITSAAHGSAIWYSFSVISGNTYYIWWDENDNNEIDSPKTLDVKLSAVYSNGVSIFTGIDLGPRSFNASHSDTVRIKVEPYYNGRTGTFAITYNTSGTRP